MPSCWWRSDTANATSASSPPGTAWYSPVPISVIAGVDDEGDMLQYVLHGGCGQFFGRE